MASEAKPRMTEGEITLTVPPHRRRAEDETQDLRPAVSGTTRHASVILSGAAERRAVEGSHAAQRSVCHPERSDRRERSRRILKTRQC